MKPDMVAYSRDHILVIDSQIITEQCPLSTANQDKVHKHEVLRSKLNTLRPNEIHLSLNLFIKLCGKQT